MTRAILIARASGGRSNVAQVVACFCLKTKAELSTALASTDKAYTVDTR